MRQLDPFAAAMKASKLQIAFNHRGVHVRSAIGPAPHLGYGSARKKHALGIVPWELWLPEGTHSPASCPDRSGRQETETRRPAQDTQAGNGKFVIAPREFRKWPPVKQIGRARCPQLDCLPSLAVSFRPAAAARESAHWPGTTARSLRGSAAHRSIFQCPKARRNNAFRTYRSKRQRVSQYPHNLQERGVYLSLPPGFQDSGARGLARVSPGTPLILIPRTA